jgi:hypothetical protein
MAIGACLGSSIGIDTLEKIRLDAAPAVDEAERAVERE